MLRGCGASGAASVGPSSFAAAASAALYNSGLRHTVGYWPSCLLLVNERAASSGIRPGSAVQAAQTPSPALALGVAAAQASAGFLEAAGTQNADMVPLQFSVRPSVLSPLFPVWNHVRQSSRRRDHLLAQLRAHTLLSLSFRGQDDRAVAGVVRQRVESIQRTASQLHQLLDDNAQPASLPCPGPAHAAAYCAALETAAQRSDPAARDFAGVVNGESSPWEHYANHFHGLYSGAPRLQPLEVIFSKPDPADLLRQLRAPAPSPSLDSSSAAVPPGQRAGSGPHISLAGVTHAAGKRKASSATLDLVFGSGRITINGMPIESYFRDRNVRRHVLEPLTLAGSETMYDMAVQVHGGGLSGQAQAVRTAMARALCVQRPALATTLAELTRWDGRVVERKKPARAKARKGFTWVKR